MTRDAGLRQLDHLGCLDGADGHAPTEPLYGGLLERCARCGLVATRERPAFEYDERYFVGDDTGGYAFDSVFAQTYDAKRFDDELGRIEASGLHGSVLDVGCATGTFLRRALARGWRCTGVEIADYARQRVQGELGVPVVASLAELPDDERYDLVTLHHVLEHIHDPLGFLRDEIRPRVGGRLLVEVPNFASLGSRVHGPGWRDLRPDQHVVHYTPTTLARLVERAGFRVREVTTLAEPLWSLRGSLYTLGLLRGLVWAPSHGNGAANGARPTASPADVTDYRPPVGLKKAATELSRLAMAPLVAALDRAGLSERLVVEARL
ncbi:MAG: class I SAM-dependent methyltransferase [Thermoanaerobaculales bacterium]|jgi:SAM-dependent methyltransferase|nr:class I SAM-dependent methyltransferase [Thermoanaerobaculales bacterium]